MVYRW
jgi:Arc/MetJ-type ribon-helix-helix transcriptional regulator